MYNYEISGSLDGKLKKLAKKDKIIYERIQKQIIKIAENPKQGKPLRNVLKGKWRVQIGSFILIYSIDENLHKVTFLEFEHHDEAY